MTFAETLIKPSSIAMAITGLVAFALVRGQLRNPVISLLILAGIGFALSYFIQAKGWAYHAFPAVALWLLAASLAFIEKRKAISAIALLVSASLVVIDLLWVGLPVTYPRVFQAVADIAPSRPKIISIAETLIAPQMARIIGGTFVGRVPNQFMSKNAYLLTHGAQPPDAATAARLQTYADFDRAILIERIRTQAPDVVLITTAWLKEWALSQPDVVQALRPYREATVVDDVAIWLRCASLADTNQRGDTDAARGNNGSACTDKR
jgi:hypothetical protein